MEDSQVKSNVLLEEVKRLVKEAERGHQEAERKLEGVNSRLREIEMDCAKAEEKVRHMKWLLPQSGLREDAPSGLIKPKLEEAKEEVRELIKMHPKVEKELSSARWEVSESLQRLREARDFHEEISEASCPFLFSVIKMGFMKVGSMVGEAEVILEEARRRSEEAEWECEEACTSFDEASARLGEVIRRFEEAEWEFGGAEWILNEVWEQLGEAGEWRPEEAAGWEFEEAEAGRRLEEAEWRLDEVRKRLKEARGVYGEAGRRHLEVEQRYQEVEQRLEEAEVRPVGEGSDEYEEDNFEDDE